MKPRVVQFVAEWAAAGLDSVGRMPHWFFQADEWLALAQAGLVVFTNGEYWACPI